MWHRYPELDALPPKARAVARVQRWRERERYAKGLSQRGTQPKPPGRKRIISEAELNYQRLRTEMESEAL